MKLTCSFSSLLLLPRYAKEGHGLLDGKCCTRNWFGETAEWSSVCVLDTMRNE